MSGKRVPARSLTWLIIGIICLSQMMVAAPAAAAPNLSPLNEPALEFVRVTNDPDSDQNPAILRATDGKLWAAWQSERSGNWDLWYKTSVNSGATWSGAIRLTDHADSDLCPAIMQAADGTVWVAWYSNRSGNWDIFYKTSPDLGGSWSADQQLTDDLLWDMEPSIAQDSGGRVWISWCSYRADSNWEIWAANTSDAGAHWSDAIRITDDSAWDYDPAILRDGAGNIWIVWYSEHSGNRDLWYRTSADGSAWSTPTRLTTDSGSDQNPGLTLAGSAIWVAWHSNRTGHSDIWYKSSSTGGASWTADTRLTEFTGHDEAPGLCGLAGSNPAFVWHSDRYGHDDIFFGIHDTHGDLDPPPHVDQIEYSPSPNPCSDDLISIRAKLSDDLGLPGITGVQLVWSVNSISQPNRQMYDDGAHDDYGNGDGWYGAQIGPLGAGSEVKYQIRASDSQANTVVVPVPPLEFQVMGPLIRTANILLILDGAGNPIDWFADYYTVALDALGRSYDVWDTYSRGAIDADTLSQYVNDAITIWAVPSYGFLPAAESQTALTGYLDAGGKLFITGQDVAATLMSTTLLSDYLHAAFVVDNTGMSVLQGVGGDPISDGMTLTIDGGDGASNQWYPDEVDPISPAETIFTYSEAGGSSSLRPPIASNPAESKETRTRGPMHLPLAGALQRHSPPAPQGVYSSGSAAVRVHTAVYKIVYFAFGFEGINSASDRQTTMGQVLSWLEDASPPPTPEPTDTAVPPTATPETPTPTPVTPTATPTYTPEATETATPTDTPEATPTATTDPDPAIPLPAYDAYGYIPGGDLSHSDAILYRFEPLDGDVTITFDAFDVDDGIEVRLVLNDAYILYLDPTANDSWDSRQVTFPDLYVTHMSRNYIRFDNLRNPPSSDRWGIRNLVLAGTPADTPTPTATSTATPDSTNTPTPTPTSTSTPDSTNTPTPTPTWTPVATATSTAVPDPAIPLPAYDAYGYIPGGDQSHPDAILYRFGPQSEDAPISFDAYDVDDGNEVRVFINDIFLQTVPATANGSWEFRRITIPRPYMYSSDWNYLRFDSWRNPPATDDWGIRNLIIVGDPTPTPTPTSGGGSVPLSPGWNLVSVPEHPIDTSITNVLSSIAGCYDIVYAYDTSDPTDPWKRFDASAAPFSNDLAVIDETKGIWIHATCSATWELPTSSPPSGTTLLHAGWNLVGYPSASAQPVADALASMTGSYDLVYGYDAVDQTDPWKMYDPSAPPEACDLAEMLPGCGYWIRAVQAGSWSVAGHQGGAPPPASKQTQESLSAPRPMLPASEPAAGSGPPPLPFSVWGAVQTDGSAATDGMTVSAWIGQDKYAETLIFSARGQSAYSLNVPGDDAVSPQREGGVAGDVVEFKVGTRYAQGSVRWQGGDSVHLDLLVSSPHNRVFLPLVQRSHP